MAKLIALALVATACNMYTPDLLECPRDRDLDWHPVDAGVQCGYAVGSLPKTSDCHLLNLTYDENHCDRTASFRCPNEAYVTQRVDVTHMWAYTTIEVGNLDAPTCTAHFEGPITRE
jgi:hypothetical protein